MPGPARRAVVIGAGIGGLSAAVGLHRLGWDVTVLERAARMPEAGTGISLLTNAQRALDQLGVGAEVRARSATMVPGGEGLRTPSGCWRQRRGDPAFWRERGLTLAVLPRPVLHGVLRRALPASVVRTRCEVTGVVNLADGAAVRYRDGRLTHTALAEVVVAADGMNSRTRRAGWPDVQPPAYSGHSVWRGIAEGVGGGAEPGGSTWGRGHEFGRMPLADDQIYWFAVANTPQGARFGDNQAEVWRRFGSWHDPIPALIAATPPDRVLHHDVYELAHPLPRYTSGRVALLGDAAHAMTSDLGQGACQAIEDAVVLCAALASDPQVPRALAEYDARRRPRTQTLVEMSRAMGQRKLTERRLELLRRNISMRVRSPREGQLAVLAIADWHPPALAALRTGTFLVGGDR